MKKLLFVFLLMMPFFLSFCKIKECELTDGRETYTSAYIETDTLTGFKGQNTLTFFNTYDYKVASGGNCIKGGKSSCISTSFSMLNLTNKNVTLKVYMSEEAARTNQTPSVVLTCSPKGVGKISSGLGIFGGTCAADLAAIGLLRVSYQ